MLSRKYYNMLAKLIKESNSKLELVNKLCDELQEDNPYFDRYRFKEASESEVLQW